MRRATVGLWFNYATTLLFQVVFAARFGAGTDAAAFQLALACGTAVLSVFISTTQSVFVPRASGHPDGLFRQSVRAMVAMAAVATLIFLVMALLSYPLAQLLTGSGKFDSRRLGMLLEEAAAWGCLQAIAGTLSGLALARGHRLLPTLTLALPTSFAGLALLLQPHLGIEEAFIWLIVGSAAQVVAILPGAFGPTVATPVNDESLLRVTLATVAISSLLAVVAPLEIAVASSHAASAGSQFAYASRSLAVAQQLLLGGVILSSLGAWSHRIQTVDSPFVKSVCHTLALSLVVIGAACAVALLAGRELVALVYQRGAFSASDTEQVYWLLLLCLGGFAFESIGLVQSQAILALRRNGMALRTGYLRTGLRIALIIALGHLMGAPGVAVAWTLSSIMGAALSTRDLKTLRLLSPPHSPVVGKTAFHVLLLVALAGLAAVVVGPGGSAVRLAILSVLVVISVLWARPLLTSHELDDERAP